MLLKKWEGNPVLKPNKNADWEKEAVLNPGAWYENGTVYMLYRASGEFEDYRIHIGLATSKDGFHFKRFSDKPVLTNSDSGFDAGCVEDPRIAKFGDTFYVTYACRAHAPGRLHRGENPIYPGKTRAETENLSRTGIAGSKDLRTFKKLGPITRSDIDDRDAILFPGKIGGKYVMLHRPLEWTGKKYGCDVSSIWLAYSDDLLHWGNDHLLAKPEQEWEIHKIGGGAKPIKTDKGWLVLYHGVNTGDLKKRAYRTGVMMLDLEDPRKIIARSPCFIMEPELPFEKKGFVDNVVFASDNVVIGDTLFVYYGGADTVVCAATCSLKEIVDYVMKFKK